MHHCDRCGREFLQPYSLTLHRPRCHQLPLPAQFLAEYAASSAAEIGRRYGLNSNWVDEHALALSRPERGPLCQRCGVGATYGGDLDPRGWCGWCRADALRPESYAGRIIGRIGAHHETRL